MHTLIANTGIQTLTFRISIDIQDRHKQWFHEWYDNESGEWKLEPVHEVCSEDQGAWYYRKAELSRAGFLAAGVTSIEISDLQHAGISPLMVDGEMCNGIPGEVFSLTFSDKANSFNAFVDEWLPAPYFFNRTEHRQTFGPLNWARFKLVPAGEEGSKKMYDVLLAFDTRAKYEGDIAESEIPVFRDRYGLDIDLSLCNNTLALFDFCSSGKQWSYVDEHLMHLVHPGVARVGLLKGNNIRRMGYVASYIFLISYLQEKNLLPAVKMYRADSVVTRDVDMVIDIGNSRTTALLTEEHEGQLDYFKQVRPLSLTDYTDMLAYDDEGKARIRTYNEPFDMRQVFRKAGFGSFGPRDSRQFVYPSFVRLGQEANILIHRASSGDDNATQSASIWNVFLLGNTREIKEALEQWEGKLKGFSEKQMSNEALLSEVPQFSSNGVSAALSQLDQMSTNFTRWHFPAWSGIIFGIVIYLMLLFPYILQERHTKSIYRLIGNEHSRQADNDGWSSFGDDSSTKKRNGKNRKDGDGDSDNGDNGFLTSF